MMHDREIIVIRRPGPGVRRPGIACAVVAGLLLWQAAGSWPLTSILGSLAFSFQVVAALPIARMALQLLRAGWEVRIDLRDRTVTRRHRSLRPRWNETYALDDFKAVELRNIRDKGAPLALTTACLVGPNAEIDLFEPPEVPSDLTLCHAFQRVSLTYRPLRQQGEEIARRCGLPFRDAVEPVEILGDFLEILYPGDPAEPVPCPEIGDVLTIRRNAGPRRFLGLFIAVDSLAILAVCGVFVALGLAGAANPIEPQFAAVMFTFSVPMAIVGSMIFTYRSEMIIDRSTRTVTERRCLLFKKWETTRPLADFAEVYLLKLKVAALLPTYLNVQLIGAGGNIQVFNATCVPRILLGKTRRLRRFDRVQRAAGALADFCSLPFRIGSLNSAPPPTGPSAEPSIA